MLLCSLVLQQQYYYYSEWAGCIFERAHRRVWGPGVGAVGLVSRTVQYGSLRFTTVYSGVDTVQGRENYGSLLALSRFRSISTMCLLCMHDDEGGFVVIIKRRW